MSLFFIIFCEDYCSVHGPITVKFLVDSSSQNVYIWNTIILIFSFFAIHRFFDVLQLTISTILMGPIRVLSLELVHEQFFQQTLRETISNSSLYLKLLPRFCTSYTVELSSYLLHKYRKIIILSNRNYLNSKVTL